MGFWIKRAFKETGIILGVFGTLVTIICIIDFNQIFPELWQRIAVVFAIFAVAFIAAFVKTFLTRKVSVDLGSGRKAVIEFGDLFAKGKRIVIPVNDSFDTEADDILISKKSVHGQFIRKIFKGKKKELDLLIEEQLKDISPCGYYSDGKNGKKKYYPLGTTIPVEQQGRTYYLLAATHFKGNNVEENLSGYYCAVLKLLEYLNSYKAGNPVYLPLLGAGLGRLVNKKEWVLDNLISVFRMSRTPLTDELHIVIHRESVWEEISLNDFKD